MPGRTKHDGKLLQVKGETHCVYPSDGGQIRVEKVQFVQGTNTPTHTHTHTHTPLYIQPHLYTQTHIYTQSQERKSKT